MLRASFIALLCAGTIAAESLFASDPSIEYAQVRDLLGQFYRRSAQKYGHDYDPNVVYAEAAQASFSDGTEASVNRKYWSELFENDIILTLPQAETLLAESHTRGKRQAQPTANSFWPNLTISYKFAWSDSTWQTLIRRALTHIERETCMRFRENGPDRDGLTFIRGSGCWSNVGKVGGSQQVSIGYGCDHLGIVAHEALHALGLWHEQSRDDRDQYVMIKTDRIIRGTEGNFEKRSSKNSDNMGQPYDLGSVMHYGPKSFSLDYNTDTIQARDWRFQQTMGQRDGISFKDAKMINMRYCKGVCSLVLSCQNGGYTDPNNCQQCRCPAGFGGRLCDQVEYSSCGSDLIATDTPKTLTSGPVYPNTHCVWRIKSHNGARVELTFEKMSFTCYDACKSYVEVKNGKEKIATGARLCCDVPTTPMTSQGDDTILIFNGHAEQQIGWHGFVVKYRSVGSPVVVRPTPAPTTTRATTTTRQTAAPAPATTRSSVTGSWGAWGGWSGCTEPCGGCGRRKRVRACYGGNGKCYGYRWEAQACNTQVCAHKKEEGQLCKGRILLPCDMMGKLDFGAPAAPNAATPRSYDYNIHGVNTNGPLPLQRHTRHVRQAEETGSEPASPLVETVEGESEASFPGFARQKRQAVPSGMCEKRFNYICPTNLLTIHMNWKNGRLSQSPAMDTQIDRPQCCYGYYASGGYCYKKQ